MKSLKQNGLWMALAMMAAVVTSRAIAQNAQTVTAQGGQAESAEAEPAREIVVSLEDHKLALLEDSRVVHVYPVAVGKASTPSPVGTYFIRVRVTNPAYYHHGKVIPPGPGNPVGNRWMSLSIPGYGIHGTNEPHSIGKAASHGCIRMGRRDIEDLFGRVRVGDKVVFIPERDAQTAQIFGDGFAPLAPVRQPVLLVKAEPLWTPTAQPALEPAEDSAAARTAENAGLMAKNASAPAAGLSAAGSW